MNKHLAQEFLNKLSKYYDVDDEDNYDIDEPLPCTEKDIKDFLKILTMEVLGYHTEVKVKKKTFEILAITNTITMRWEYEEEHIEDMLHIDLGSEADSLYFYPFDGSFDDLVSQIKKELQEAKDILDVINNKNDKKLNFKKAKEALNLSMQNTKTILAEKMVFTVDKELKYNINFSQLSDEEFKKIINALKE